MCANRHSLRRLNCHSLRFLFELECSKCLMNNLIICLLYFLLYRCDERIQKIQTIKMMEGIFICAAPHCLKSFLKKTEFESHIHETHADLLQRNAEREDGNESEAVSTKQSTASESTARAPPRPIFSPNSSSQVHDREDKTRYPQPRDHQPPRATIQQKPPPSPFYGQVQNHPSESGQSLDGQ